MIAFRSLLSLLKVKRLQFSQPFLTGDVVYSSDHSCYSPGDSCCSTPLLKHSSENWAEHSVEPLLGLTRVERLIIPFLVAMQTPTNPQVFSWNWYLMSCSLRFGKNVAYNWVDDCFCLCAKLCTYPHGTDSFYSFYTIIPLC